MSARGEGPYALLAHTPALADSFRQLGQHFRDGVDVPPALRELAILGTARSWSGDYVWNAHFARAQELLSPDVVKGLAQEAVPQAADEAQALVLRMCLRLRDHGAVNAALWQQLLALFGAKQAVELLVICGIYRCVLGLAGTPTVNAADGRVDEAGLPQPGIARVASG